MSTPGASFGGAGGAFSQAFAQTLLHGSQIIAQVQDRRDELDLRKKLVSAQLQEHDAKTELANRALKGAASLQSRMTAQSWPDSELGAGGTTTPAPLSEQERMQYALQIDPHAAAKEMLAGGRRLSLQDMMTAGAAWMGGGSQTATATTGVPVQPTAATQPDAGPTPDQKGGAATPALGPQTKLDRSFSVVIDKDGSPKLDLKIGEKHIALDMKHEFEPLPDGRIQNYRAIFNPDTGAVQRTPVGAPQLPAAQQDYAQAAISWGLKPGTETFAMAIADQAAVNTMYQGNARTIAFEDLKKSYRAMATGTPTATGAPASSPRERAQAADIQQGAAKVKAEAEARLSVPEKASPAERDKLTNQLASGDLYGQIKGLYAPEMVGPLRGGPSAAVREKTGMMSQQEQQFRTAVTTANNQMIKDITGAQMSEPEAQRLMRQMPDPTLPANQFEARLKQTIVNQKIIAIRRRQVLEGTGVDVSNVPKVTLTTEERRQVAAPIAQDFKLGQITRQQAVQQLMGLGQYGEQGAHALLTVIEQGNR